MKLFQTQPDPLNMDMIIRELMGLPAGRAVVLVA